MGNINYLRMECSKCKVSDFCPKKGSSPTTTNSNKKAFCFLVGGYGRDPIDESILNDESKKRVKPGYGLTIAEVPVWIEEVKEFTSEVVLVFAPVVRHARETVSYISDPNPFRKPE